MTTEEAYTQFDNYLDELYPEVIIAGVYIGTASSVLYQCDPIAYRCAFNDWADSEGIDTDALQGDFYRH